MTESLTANSMTKPTTLVTVTYADRANYLRELLLRSFETERVHRAIVVSNASTSDLKELEDEWGTRLRVIRLDRNSGSANGYSVGIAAALDDGAEFIWLMDDDNAPKDLALTELHMQLEKITKLHGAERSAVLGFRPSHQADIAQGIHSARAYPPRSSFFGFHYRQLFFKIKRRLGSKKNLSARPDTVHIPYAPYGGLMASRELFKAIGLPNIEFILYADDTEYTSRITSRGGVISLVTRAELEDLENSWNLKDSYSNTFLGWLKGGSEFRAFYAARNQAYFDRRVWMDSWIEYKINQYIYVGLLTFFAISTRRLPRYRLLMGAIRDGKASLLGIAKNFTL
ncbi:glycosyltransferase [Stenotrophomonas bentonitica]|uniref:glycosyltransferase n=1 Tax=Stenotrophomonas bentonitica TaxID=1450134 RepID=UPI0037CD86DF